MEEQANIQPYNGDGNLKEVLEETFKFTMKWRDLIHPLDLINFLYGAEMINFCFDNNPDLLVEELHRQLYSGKISIVDFRQFTEKFKRNK